MTDPITPPPADPPADPPAPPADPSTDMPGDPPANLPADPHTGREKPDTKLFGIKPGDDAEPLPDWAKDLVRNATDKVKSLERKLEEATGGKPPAEVERLRREAQSQRIAKGDAEAKLSSVLEALGVKPNGDEPPDPDALKQTIAARDGELRQSKVELAAYRAAGKAGANPDALLDSASFLKAIGELDPAGDTFSADLESAIKKAAEGNPLLTASPGGGRKGPAQGARGNPSPQQPASLEDAFAAHYNGG